MTALVRKFLRPGRFYASRRPVMTETLVGSCVTVCLYNAKGGFGAMNHFLRDRPKDESNPEIGAYGTSATRHIVNAMSRIDGEPRHHHASIFGGAAVLEVLKAAGIRVVRQEVSGTRGRRVTFNTLTGLIECRFAGDIPRKKSPQGTVQI